MMRIMGLDLGTKTIGVAFSDESGLTAQPFCVIRRKSFARDLEELRKLADEHSVKSIVVGMPVNMDGTMGPRSEETLKFVEKLKEKVSVPVETWDERLSTAAVTRLLIEGDMSRSKRKAVVDKLAASYILQGYLDKCKAGRQAHDNS